MTLLKLVILVESSRPQVTLHQSAWITPGTQHLRKTLGHRPQHQSQSSRVRGVSKKSIQQSIGPDRRGELYRLKIREHLPDVSVRAPRLSRSFCRVKVHLPRTNSNADQRSGQSCDRQAFEHRAFATSELQAYEVVSTAKSSAETRSSRRVASCCLLKWSFQAETADLQGTSSRDQACATHAPLASRGV